MAANAPSDDKYPTQMVSTNNIVNKYGELGLLIPNCVASPIKTPKGIILINSPPKPINR
jgi:hypothetical protein